MTSKTYLAGPFSNTRFLPNLTEQNLFIGNDLTIPLAALPDVDPNLAKNMEASGGRGAGGSRV